MIDWNVPVAIARLGDMVASVKLLTLVQMVARGGIEPPTRGFSDRGPNRPNLLNRNRSGCCTRGIFSAVTHG